MELFFHPIFCWIYTTLCTSGYKIIGRHRQQRYAETWLSYSDHIKPGYLSTTQESLL